MASRDLRDWLLLGTLLPLALGALALHVREVARTGGGELPIFVAYTDARHYPRVAGIRLEQGTDSQGFEVGDRLLALDGLDLRGLGFLGFETLAHARVAQQGEAMLALERDGARLELPLRLRHPNLPWSRLLVLLSLVGVGTIVLVRSPNSPEDRLLFAAFTGLVICEAPFRGASVPLNWISWAIFELGVGLAASLLLRFFIGFPREVPPEKRVSRHWCWLGLAVAAVRAPLYVPGPVRAELVPGLELAMDALVIAAGAAISVWNFSHAAPIGRRRSKWVALFLWVGFAPLILALVGHFISEQLAFHTLLPYAFLSTSLAPIGVLIGTQRVHLDVDRAFTTTAAYSAAAVLTLAAVLAVAPSASSALAQATGLAETPSAWIVAFALALISVPLALRLRPYLTHLLFPEREALQRGFRQLLADLSSCESQLEVLDLLGERLTALLRLERGFVFVAGEAGFATRPPGASPLRFAPRGRLALALERDPVPVVLASGRLERALPDLEADERAALDALAPALLLPVRSGKNLAAFAALGPKHSGDVFTQTDVALLAAAAEKASAELRRLRDAQTIAVERGRAKRLRERAESAAAESETKTRLLATASHDLRQPLHALVLFAERLVGAAHGGELAVLAERIRASARALAEMFDAVLDLSRLEAGVVAPHPEDVALEPLLGRLVDESRELAGAKGLALCYEPRVLWARTDPVLFARIVQNLLANAIRHTDAGEVHLRTYEQAGEIALEVSDTGPGIPRERREEMFREFAQLERDRDRGGLGLGLSIVARSAELLGHRVEVSERPGGGSVFRVLAARGAPPDGHAAAGSAREADSCIVVVEDDRLVLDALAGLLESWGYRVVRGESPEEALANLAQLGRAPSLIVADYRLRDAATGIDAIRAIRGAAGRPVPAVVVTGESGSEPLEAIRASDLPFLRKPVPPAKLRALLGELLRPGERVLH